MSVLVANEVQDTTENWDDDFEFQPRHGSSPRRSIGSSKRKESLLEGLPPLSRDTRNTINSRTSLQQWAESGPSTPSKRIHTQTENWDDDFQDTRDSPIRQYATESSPRSRRSRRRPSMPGPENWDDDFEVDGKPASPSGKSTRWDSSDDEGQEHGLAEREEDRTVTSRVRRGGLPRSPFLSDTPPPVPPIPSSLSSLHADPAPFPRSPTLSVFSVPGSARDSVATHSYSSTAHLALRSTPSGSSLGALPPSPPTHHARERRRLRKKSRPARVEANIYEMEDRADMPLRPATPENAEMDGGITSASEAAPDPTPPSAIKSSLVSRIGSVGRKWGAARRKRASTGPAEVAAQERRSSSRPASVAITPSPSSSKSWFFRHGGAHGAGSGSPPSQASALPLKHEKSVDRLLALVGFDYSTPSRIRRKDKAGSSSDLPGTANDSNPAAFLFGSSKRPVSMQVTPSSNRFSRRYSSRHASYGQNRDASSSCSSLAARSASDCMEELVRKRSRGTLPRDEVKTPKGPRRKSSEHDMGIRSSGSDSRKLSLKSKHSRTYSKTMATSRGSIDGSRRSTSTTATAIPRHIPDRSEDATPRPHSRIKGLHSTEQSLLPPIELQPPSPPRSLSLDGLTVAESDPVFPGTASQEPRTPVLRPSKSMSPNGMQMFTPSPTPSPTRQKPSTSPQSASLGRTTQLPKDTDHSGTMQRRSSLGDLKIPERISQAQTGLRRDLGMVREFAASIDRLKDLKMSYDSLTSEIQAFLVETLPPEPPKSRAASPPLFGLSRPRSRARSNTNPQTVAPPSKEEANHRQLVVTYRSIEARYRLTWECTELLIELGGGPSTSAEPSSASLLPPSQNVPIFEGRRSRDRAITLSGEESKPLVAMPNMSHTTLPLAHHPSGAALWRASTGRHDLSQRQLMLLRDMLSSPDASAVLAQEYRIPEEEVNRDWRWGDATNSTVTLPTEESSQTGSDIAGSAASSAMKRRKSGRLGMRGLRDMLRSLKKTYSSAPSMSQESQHSNHSHADTNPPASSSTDVSLSTTSSLNMPQSHSESVALRRRAKTSTGPESIRSVQNQPSSPYVAASAASMGHRSSPRRPSLASIFRLGQKSKSAAKANPPAVASDLIDAMHHVHMSREPSSVLGMEDEDWDQVGSSSELDLTSASSTVRAEKSGTIRGRKGRSPYSVQPNTSLRQGANPSRSSVWTVDIPQSLPQREVSVVPPASVEGQIRTTKLSNVREVIEKESPQQTPSKRSSSKTGRRSLVASSPSPRRPRSRSSKISMMTSSSARPYGHGISSEANAAYADLQDTKLTLAMTPENIKPLLENAKEVQERCKDCLGELRQLLDPQRQV